MVGGHADRRHHCAVDGAVALLLRSMAGDGRVAGRRRPRTHDRKPPRRAAIRIVDHRSRMMAAERLILIRHSGLRLVTEQEVLATLTTEEAALPREVVHVDTTSFADDVAAGDWG